MSSFGKGAHWEPDEEDAPQADHRGGPNWEAALRDVGPLPFLRELEGHAFRFTAPGELAHQVRISPEMMVYAHKIPVDEQAPRGTLGWCSPAGISVAPGLSGERLREVMTKEVTRWLLFREGINPPEQDIIVGELSLCWQMPYRACQRLRDAGGDFTGAVRAFVLAYKGLTAPELILTRAAQACDVALRLYPAASSPFSVIPQQSEINMRMTPREERQLVDDALDIEFAAYARGEYGTKAIRYPDGNRHGVAIVLDRGSFREETRPEFVAAVRASWRESSEPR